MIRNRMRQTSLHVSTNGVHHPGEGMRFRGIFFSILELTTDALLP